MEQQVEVLEIPPHGALDRIIVYFYNKDKGQGHVTITCWGCAWTTYFGSMGDLTIAQFVKRVEPDYLLPKLQITNTLKQGKKHDAYLRRIIVAVQEALQ